MNHETEYNEKNDLFYNYDKQPPELKAICDRYAEMDNDYQTCEKFLAEVQQIGYTFDYGLCGEPFNLRKLELKTYLLKYQHRHGEDAIMFRSEEDWEMYYAEDNGEEDPEGLKAIKELGEKLGIDFEPERFDEYYSIERIYPDDAPVI